MASADAITGSSSAASMALPIGEGLWWQDPGEWDVPGRNAIDAAVGEGSPSQISANQHGPVELRPRVIRGGEVRAAAARPGEVRPSRALSISGHRRNRQCSTALAHFMRSNSSRKRPRRVTPRIRTEVRHGPPASAATGYHRADRLPLRTE